MNMTEMILMSGAFALLRWFSPCGDQIRSQQPHGGMHVVLPTRVLMMLLVAVEGIKGQSQAFKKGLQHIKPKVKKLSKTDGLYQELAQFQEVEQSYEKKVVNYCPGFEAPIIELRTGK